MSKRTPFNAPRISAPPQRPDPVKASTSWWLDHPDPIGFTNVAKQEHGSRMNASPHGYRAVSRSPVRKRDVVAELEPEA